VAAAGAASTVTSNLDTRAAIGPAAVIQVDALVIQSTHEQDFDASADSFALALAAGSGAEVQNSITNQALVDIGTGARVTANAILIHAKNQVTKNRLQDSSNLRSGSASGGNVTLLHSKTQLGSKAVVTVGDGAQLVVQGDHSNPGVFRIEAHNDIVAVDSVRIESVSGFGISTGISQIETDTLAQINVDTATLESKAGPIYLTAKTDSNVTSSTNLLVATALGGAAGAEATAAANATNEIRLSNASIKAADVHLYAGRDSLGMPNLINTFANTELTAASIGPNIVVPIPTADIRENNLVTIDGQSSVRALSNIHLLALEGMGGDQRRQTSGVALSLSLIPYGFPIPGHGAIASTNSVNIGPDASMEAGINRHAVMTLKPTILNENMDPDRLNGDLADRLLTDDEKRAEGISFVDISPGDYVQVVEGAHQGGLSGQWYRYQDLPDQLVLSNEDYSDTASWEHVTEPPSSSDTTYASDFVTNVDYEYCALNVGEIAFPVTIGTVVEIAADGEGNPVAGGGQVGGLYQFIAEIDAPTPIVLHRENYEDASRWEQLVLAFDLKLDPPSAPVSLETGQIVRIVDDQGHDVLYEYLGEGRSDVDLDNEDFTDSELWKELASVIDRSDLAVSFQEALNNKFYVVKPTRLDLPTMTVQNVGGLLLAQRANPELDREPLQQHRGGRPLPDPT
jgi:hypothetical protein